MKWIIILILFLSGCELTKQIKHSTSDSTSLNKSTVNAVDTSKGGSVKTTNTTTKEDFDWYKITQLFSQNKDTSINNTNVYPSTVIYEGGKGTKEQVSNTIDSSWFKNQLSFMTLTIDSLNKKIETYSKDKHSETKGVGLIMVIIIVVCGMIAYFLLSKILGGYTIVKKIIQ